MLKRAIIRPALILLASLSLALTVLATFPVYQAEAAGGYNAANIIHDSNFYTSSPTMSVQEIQNFLNVQGKNCKSRPGLPCLKDFKQTTKSRPADRYCPKPYQGAANESAATIIWKTSNACNISPQAILVTLQKEQSLVTSTANGASGYRSAMGYGCPDFAKCNSVYYGFSNQVYNGARQFQRYRLQPNSFNFAAGRTSFIQYNPIKSCGGTYVKVQNAATAALYNYTPYQPGGQGRCQTYGNHNFFKFYSAWFGDPQTVKKAQPPAQPVTPKANTAAPTGTMKATVKQEAPEKKEEPQKVEPLTVSVQDAQGKAIDKDKGVKAGSEMILKVSQLDPKTKPAVSVDGATQSVETKVVEAKTETVEIKLTAPEQPGLRLIKVTQVGEDGKVSEPQREGEAQVWVLYEKPTFIAVTNSAKAAVKDGDKVLQGETLQVKVAGYDPETTPAIGVVSAADPKDQSQVKAAAANGLGVIEFALPVPQKLGKYNIVLPAAPQKPATDEKASTEAKEGAKDKASSEAQEGSDEKASTEPHEGSESKVNTEAKSTTETKDNTETKPSTDGKESTKEKEDADNKVGASFAFEVIQKPDEKPSSEDANKVEAPKGEPRFLGATDKDGKPIEPGAEITANEVIIIKIEGVTPNEEPHVELHSTPLVLPVGKADAEGRLTFTFNAPAEKGLHHVKIGKEAGKGELMDLFHFKSNPPQQIKTQPAAVQHTSQLAQTGQSTAPLVAMMIMLVGAGLAANSYGRARRPISVN